MVSSESSTHSFVVRIWLEETADEIGRDKWRGHVTHVASGASCYFNELAEITAFIAHHLGGSATAVSAPPAAPLSLYQRLRRCWRGQS